MPNKKETKIEQTFSVTAKVKLIVSVDIKAKTYTEAVEVAKTLTWDDFVNVEGELIDNELVGIEYIGAAYGTHPKL